MDDIEKETEFSTVKEHKLSEKHDLMEINGKQQTSIVALEHLSRK
jgi:hypothetical protein